MRDQRKADEAKQQFKKCSPTFIALGDLTRQKLCMDLALADDGGLNVAQLAGRTHLSRPAISHHLKVLKDCGIVEPIKKGTQIFYRLNIKHRFEEIKQLVAMLDELLHEEDTNAGVSGS